MQMYRILLADDEGIVLNSLQFIIEKNFSGRYELETAKTGLGAIETAERFRPDIVFMDIQMPVMDGYEATRQIRKMDRSDTKTLPIYAVSANALASDIQNAKDAGMDGHIAKPVDFDSIERVLKQYLS